MTEATSQTLQDYHVILEYKNLKQWCPRGVFVMPSLGSMRVWHGVVFIRSAHYKNGIFKFRMDIPSSYPNNGAIPYVTFHTPVFHPMVEEATGELDLSEEFPVWEQGKHYLVHILRYIKKLFYTKDFKPSSKAFNPVALELFLDASTDGQEKLITSIGQCVANSIALQYDNIPGSSLRFTEPTSKHDEIKKRIFSNIDNKS